MGFATLALLTLAATLGGFVDAIAGGGGLITLPALLFAGLSPADAIATNKLQGTFGVASASLRHFKEGAVDSRALRAAVAATAAAAALGAALASRIDVAALRSLMPYALVAAAAYFALAPAIREHARVPFWRPPHWRLVLAARSVSTTGFLDRARAPFIRSPFSHSRAQIC